jgi:cyanate permease
LKTADYIVIVAGLIVTTIGYILRPTDLGWFLLGFGTAHIILGILDLVFHHPTEKVNPS